MAKNTTPWKLTATLVTALAIVLSGCGSKNESIPVPTSTTEVVASTENSTAENNLTSSELDEQQVEKAPEDQAEVTPSVTPTASSEPAATTKPVESIKPTATVKPTAKPSASPKPTATSKPVATAKPAETSTPAATAKPTVKPSATPKPSEKPAPTATPEASSVVLSDIAAEIKTEASLSMMGEATGDMIKDIFYVDSSLYEEGIFQMAMINIRADDLAIVKLKSESDYNSVKDALTKRAEDVIKTFSTYLPDQHENAKNYQIVQNGLYVLYSISGDQDKVLEVFNNYTK